MSLLSPFEKEMEALTTLRDFLKVFPGAALFVLNMIMEKKSSVLHCGDDPKVWRPLTPREESVLGDVLDPTKSVRVPEDWPGSEETLVRVLMTSGPVMAVTKSAVSLTPCLPMTIATATTAPLRLETALHSRVFDKTNFLHVVGSLSAGGGGPKVLQRSAQAMMLAVQCLMAGMKGFQIEDSLVEWHVAMSGRILALYVKDSDMVEIVRGLLDKAEVAYTFTDGIRSVDGGSTPYEKHIKDHMDCAFASKKHSDLTPESHLQCRCFWPTIRIDVYKTDIFSLTFPRDGFGIPVASAVDHYSSIFMDDDVDPIKLTMYRLLLMVRLVLMNADVSKCVFTNKDTHSWYVSRLHGEVAEKARAFLMTTVSADVTTLRHAHVLRFMANDQDFFAHVCAYFQNCVWGTRSRTDAKPVLIVRRTQAEALVKHLPNGKPAASRYIADLHFFA